MKDEKLNIAYQNAKKITAQFINARRESACVELWCGEGEGEGSHLNAEEFQDGLESFEVFGGNMIK